MSTEITNTAAAPPSPAAQVAVASAATRPSFKAQTSAPRQIAESEPAFDPAEMQRRLSAVINQLNEQMRHSGRDLSFSIDNVLDRPVITVKSASTGEIVRQIPNEALLRIAHNLENIKGLLQDGVF